MDTAIARSWIAYKFYDIGWYLLYWFSLCFTVIRVYQWRGVCAAKAEHYRINIMHLMAANEFTEYEKKQKALRREKHAVRR